MKQRISCFLVSLFIVCSFTVQAQLPTTGWDVLDDFSDGTFTSTTGGTGNSKAEWTIRSGGWNVTGQQLVTDNTNNRISTPFTRVCNAWEVDIDPEITVDGQFNRYFFFMTNVSADPLNASGYQVIYDQGNAIDPPNNGVIALRRIDNGVVGNTIVKYTRGLTINSIRVSVTRSNNVWTLYVDGVNRSSGTDATYSPESCAFQGAWFTQTNATNNDALDNIRFIAEPFNSFATAPYLEKCSALSFYNTTGTGADRISTRSFDSSFGTFIRNSGSFKLRGAEIKTFKPAGANVCLSVMNYRVFRNSTTPGNFDTIRINFDSDCNGSQFPSGGPCIPGQQKWQTVNKNIDLTAFAPGDYTLEIFYKIAGSNISPSSCSDTTLVNNNGNNYKATFTIVEPTLGKTDPTGCQANNGSITIGGLAASTSYGVRYSFNDIVTGPLTLTSSSTGSIVLNGLAAGTYNSFELVINQCTIPVSGSLTLIRPDGITISPPTINDNSVCNGTPGGGTPGGCVPNGTGVVINEVRHFINVSGSSENIAKTGKEYVELYNPTCNPIDISCYMLGSSSFTPTSPSSRSDFAIILPQNIILNPKEHYVIGSSSISNIPASVDFKTNENQTNLCSSVPNNMVLPNSDGWVALYKPDGSPVDAIYWTVAANQESKISTDEDFNDNPCTPSSITGCTTADIILSSAKEIYNLDSKLINYVGITSPNPLQPSGKTFSRIPDGGSWQPNIDPSIDGNNCNGGTCPPPPPPTSTGTCNGSALVTVSGSGPFSYEWRNSSNTVIGKDSAGIGNLCAGTYTVRIRNTTTGCDSIVSITVKDIKPVIFDKDTTVCAPTTVNLTAPAMTAGATPGLTYAYFSDAASTILLPNPSAVGAGTFYIVGSTATGCTDTARITVTQNPKPVINDKDTTVCALTTVNLTDASITLGATSGLTYTYFSDAAATSVLPNPNAVGTGNYYIVGSLPTGCTDTARVTVTQSPKPNINDKDTTVCAPTTVNLADPAITADATSGLTYTYYSDAAANNLLPNPNAVGAGTYYIVGATSTGCTDTARVTVTVNPKVEPTFDPVAGFCQGAILTQVILPITSNNGITGTWNPPGLSSDVAGDIKYVFTPNAQFCADTASITVTVTPNVTPTFTFGTSLIVCALGNVEVPSLPTTSQNGVTGTWNPDVVSNTTGGTYTFTPENGQCATTATLTVTVNQPVTPTFTYGTALTICSGGNVPERESISTNNIVGLWDPPVNFSNTESNIYTFIPAPSACATQATFTVTVNPTPTLSPLNNIVVNDGDLVNEITLTGNPEGTVFSWVNSIPGIGLAASGVGNIPSFNAVNLTDADLVSTVTVTPKLNTCNGDEGSFKITVKPRTKDVFVPNVFSPNGDGKNDLLKVYGNYITSLEMRIFNQWGEQVTEIRNITQGWDGTFKGKPQPVGVYVYVLKATLSTGKTVTLKGSITLVR